MGIFGGGGDSGDMDQQTAIMTKQYNEQEAANKAALADLNAQEMSYLHAQDGPQYQKAG